MAIEEWLGVAGFVLALVNALQTWWRRPVVTLHPSEHVADESVIIEIQNRYNRPITIIRSRCWPSEHHQLRDSERNSRAQVLRPSYNDISRILQADAKQKFNFIRTGSKAVLLLIYWQLNAAIAFSKFPLLILLTESRCELLRRSR
jgi:hypothetical protein